MEIVVNSSTVVPEKRFGTVLVAICFVNYLVLVLG